MDCFPEHFIFFDHKYKACVYAMCYKIFKKCCIIVVIRKKFIPPPQCSARFLRLSSLFFIMHFIRGYSYSIPARLNDFYRSGGSFGISYFIWRHQQIQGNRIGVFAVLSTVMLQSLK